MSIICNATHFHVPYWGICDTDFAAAWFMLVGCEYHRKNIHIYKKVLMLGFFCTPFRNILVATTNDKHEMGNNDTLSVYRCDRFCSHFFGFKNNEELL